MLKIVHHIENDIKKTREDAMRAKVGRHAIHDCNKCPIYSLAQELKKAKTRITN